MVDEEKTVFISYRRNASAFAALAIFQNLIAHGYDVFMDVESIDSGTFDTIIFNQIAARAHFLVILTPDSAERLVEPGDWLRREIEHAMELKRNIVPVLVNDFKFGDYKQYFTGRLSDLPRYNGLIVPQGYFEDAMKKLRTRFLRKPVAVTIRPTPPSEQPVIERKIEEVTRMPAPTETQLEAVQDFDSGQLSSTEKELEKTSGPTPISAKDRSEKYFEPEMILIPAGEFLMGSDPDLDKDARDDEQPQHRLYLPDYYIAKTPVTNTEYAAFVQATGHRVPYRDANWANPYNWDGQRSPIGKEDHPVVIVSWHDAVAYCKWLAGATGKPYRLPTEAEWEKGARETDGRIYPWGNQWDAKRCNTRKGGQGGTTSVGAYSHGASPYGLLDMAGNVWEWCATKADKPYPYDVEEDEWSTDYLQGSGVRVLRGGSWRDNQDLVRCVVRKWDNPDFKFRFGFRVACHVTT